ncbi:uncharacterized protein (TIGR02678 family) [Actinocorallia herbida]|uniref:Uncharacterized protein (TIGR02678 family) n=1 Tax=Actinocorallia herbida TaxID=58109 RepID=A0A3N1CPF0_9ACTN|nr:DUF2398 family protein [Actinocorallia herbida]ROO83034.1 uncharacterized protein (TIGR02678 family) [Actinocorallia herbida]
MAEPRAAADVADADLGSYQAAVRLVLSHGLITARHPRPGILDRVLPWADLLARDLRDLCGYTLVATTRQVRLVRRLDGLDPSRGRVFVNRAGRAFDRRRLAYLCLVLSTFQRSRVEVSLTDIVRALTPAAQAIDGLGYDPLQGPHKAAVVDVVGWLLDRDALAVSDGSVEAWARSAEGDALFDVDHDICAALLRPARPLQHLTGAAGLLEDPHGPAAARVRRMVLERPVVYYADLDPEAAAVLRRDGLAENLARLTGTVVERRAEGVSLIDPSGSFTDRPFPGRGALARAAGLLLGKVADALDGGMLRRAAGPSDAEEQAALRARLDKAVPEDTLARGMAWDLPRFASPEVSAETLPLVERHRLEQMVQELYTEFGADSFTAAWRADPLGLLDASLAFLSDLRLVRPVPGGVLVLPAAVRYRNITQALPTPDGQIGLFAGATAQEQP